MSHKLSSNHLAKNTFFLYILTFSNYFLGLLLYPYLSRVLTIEVFGLFGFAMSFVTIFQTIVDFGFMISATALISKHRSDSAKVSEIISTTIEAKLILCFVSLLLFLTSSFFTPMIREHFLFVFLFFINAIVTAMMPDFFFRGIEQMKNVTIRAVTSKVLGIIAVILLVHDDSQILLIPLSLIIGNIVALITALILMRRANVKLRRVQAKMALKSIKTGMLFFISRLAISINSSLGSFFLGLKFLPASFEVGVYAGASRLSSASEMMLTPVVDSVYPHMINKKDYRFFKKILTLGTGIWLVLIVGAMILAEPICVIILGEEYAAAGNYLRLLLISAFFAYPGMMLGFPALSPIGQAKHANIAVFVTATINIVACTILWLTDSVSLFSVCLVVATTNITMLTYRAIAFYKNRHLISVMDKNNE